MRISLGLAPAIAGALLFACSSDPGSSPSGSDAGSVPHDSGAVGWADSGADGGDGGGGDATVAPSDAGDGASSDAGTSVDASDGSTQGLPGPHPPPNTTRCNQGSLTAADITNGCNVPTSFGPAPINACQDATSDGGKFEVWCGATATYVWAEIDAIRATSSTCPVGAGSFVLDIDSNYTFSAGSVGAGPATLTSTGPSPYSLGTSRSVVVEATFGATDAHGSFTLWVTGEDSLCPQEAGTNGALVAGVSQGW